MHRRNSKITWILALFVLLPLGSGLPINERTLSRGPLSQISLSRRDLFSFVSSSPLTFIILFPQSVSAAAPITQGETENLGAKAQRFFRPKPPKILRKKVDKDLAVLLMRSSYNALDDLNCIPMDQFQRDFFIIRQAEYEPYVDSLGQGLVRQGDLTDPYYFDFISYAQYHTINREITQNPPYIFEEKQPVEVGEGKSQEFTTVVVRRDPSIANQMLPLEHSKRVGKSILDQFDERYGNTPAALPKPDLNGRPDSSFVLAALDQLVKIFLLNGFAWSGGASIASSGSLETQFCLTLVSPATIWSGKALEQEKSKVTNDFLLKTASELVGRYGYRIISSAVKYEGTKEISFLTVR